MISRIRPLTLRPAGGGWAPATRSGSLAVSTGPYAVAVGLAVATGALLVKSPTAGVALVAAIGIGAAASRLTRLGAVEVLLGLLPWLVVFDGLLPALLRTFVTTAAAIALLALAAPLRFRRILGPVAAGLFVAVVLGHGIFATHYEQFTQVAKYMIFPAVSVAVLSKGGQERLPQARNVILASCLAALMVHLGVIAAGLGETGTKYEIGEKLGFGRGIVHEMTLTFVIVAAAGLVSSRRVPVQLAFFALGAVPAMLTGVRSALLALLVVVFIYVVRSRFDRRAVAIIVSLLVVAFASGAAKIVQERFEKEARSETSLASAGSERGAIWTVAVTPWWNAGPPQWLFGTGLGSVEAAEIRELGTPFFGHSDLIEVGVTFGLVGLFIWALLWFALLRSPLESIVLVPLIVYALVNGSMLYVAPLTLGLAFSAACRAPPEGETAR
ncbi:MAG TPA: O-antigen ligase family protein [Solirubrobacterales bacterium]|nr:O-antigen ligase family protein [Solirubrobacterales bacterium]